MGRWAGLHAATGGRVHDVVSSRGVCQHGRRLKLWMRIGVCVELLDLRWERGAPTLWSPLVCRFQYVLL